MYNEDLIDAAKVYIEIGFSVVATDGTKKALFPWKKYQSEIISELDIEKQLSHEKAKGIAIICGAVSGNLEVLDIDLKNDLTKKLYERITDNLPVEIFEKLTVIKTRSGGYHFYYRCEKIEGNQKLASRLPSGDEKKKTPHLKQVVLIETRGEAGYVVAPPTDGYSIISGEIKDITIDEREIILSICRAFSEIETETQKDFLPANRIDFGEKPWDDYNNKADAVSLLQSHGWTRLHTSGERIYFTRPGKSDGSISGDYHTGKNLFKVFSTSSEFEPEKAYTPFGIYCLLEHSGDPSRAAKELIKLGYGERQTPVKTNIKKLIRRLIDTGNTNDQVKEKLIRDSGLAISEAETVLSDYVSQCGEKILSFWDVDDKGKITIVRNKLANFLTVNGGFSLFFFDASTINFKLVCERDGFLEEVSTEKIKKFVTGYIKSLSAKEPFDFGTTSDALVEVIHKGSDAYFSKGALEFLEEKKFKFLKDTKNEILFPFNNGILKIEKDKISLNSYSDFKSVIWRSQVINFNIVIDTDFDPTLCEFNRFIQNVCGGDKDKINYCYSLIGYLLHKFKDASRPWAIIFAEETDDENKGGGTGKGILVKAISSMIKCERIDGKNFKVDKNFAFQRVGLDTKLIALEDLRKDFDFEGYNSVVSEGLTVEKKNKDEMYLPYEFSPKVILTTNYSIPSVGVHAKRRQRVFEFSSHYNNNHTPVDEFGHLLFEDWDEDEWNRFYNLMFYCCRFYLKNGVSELSSSEKMKRKHIKVHFTKEFLQYFDDLSKNEGYWLMFGEEYANFITQNNWDKKDYSVKRFKRALTESCQILGFEFSERRNRAKNNLNEFKVGSGNIEAVVIPEPELKF